jgi:hypothetical protein
MLAAPMNRRRISQGTIVRLDTNRKHNMTSVIAAVGRRLVDLQP